MNNQICPIFFRVRVLTLSCVFSFFFIDAFSQEIGFKTAKNFIAEESNQMNKQSEGVTTSSKSLLEDLHPSVYLENGLVKNYGSNPKCLFVNSIANLSNVANPFTKTFIEIVTIKINAISDLSQQLDLSVFSEFPSLRIIYVVVPFDCNVSQLNSFIQNQTTNYHLVYTIENPS